jgi:hypothetical protein
MGADLGKQERVRPSLVSAPLREGGSDREPQGARGAEAGGEAAEALRETDSEALFFLEFLTSFKPKLPQIASIGCTPGAPT